MVEAERGLAMAVWVGLMEQEAAGDWFSFPWWESSPLCRKSKDDENQCDQGSGVQGRLEEQQLSRTDSSRAPTIHHRPLLHHPRI